VYSLKDEGTRIADHRWPFNKCDCIGDVVYTTRSNLFGLSVLCDGVVYTGVQLVD
jgi:hypothetical protein